MSDIPTDKHLNSGIKKLQKLKDNEEWLVVKDIRFGKELNADGYRNLMALLVKDEHAFDKGEYRNPDRYEISANWKKKDEMLAKLKPKFFLLPALLDLIEIIDIRPIGGFSENLDDVERILGRSLDLNDLKNWLECQHFWGCVYEIMRGFQITGKLEIESLSENFKLENSKKKYLLSMADEVVNMYKAIECACLHGEIKVKYIDEISDKLNVSEYPAEVAAIELFIDLLVSKIWDDFIIRCLYISSNPSAKYRHIENFIESYKNIKKLLSNPVPDEGKNRDTYQYDLNDAKEAFYRAKRLIEENQPQRLLEFVNERASEANPEFVLFYKLRDSSIPEVAEAAQKWADARGNKRLKAGQGFLRKRAEGRKGAGERRKGKPKRRNK